MDYDRYDAILHHIYKQTQGDAWFRPNEDQLPCGVAIRVGEAGEFRVFPYENIALEPFEMAVAALNPAVAVKVRSAAVHATLAEAYVGFDHRTYRHLTRLCPERLMRPAFTSIPIPVFKSSTQWRIFPPQTGNNLPHSLCVLSSGPPITFTE